MPNPESQVDFELPAGISSIWELKPWWCQPWSILLTGLAIMAGSWWILQLRWLTLVLSLLVCGWWYLFLVLMPTVWKPGPQKTPPDGSAEED